MKYQYLPPNIDTKYQPSRFKKNHSDKFYISIFLNKKNGKFRIISIIIDHLPGVYTVALPLSIPCTISLATCSGEASFPFLENLAVIGVAVDYGLISVAVTLELLRAKRCCRPCKYLSMSAF